MRDWWLRALLVLQRPRPVFVALRDESKEAVSERAEPMLAIVLLAGIASGALDDDGRHPDGRRDLRRRCSSRSGRSSRAASTARSATSRSALCCTAV